MQVITGFSFWILLCLLILFSTLWGWVAVRRHKKNNEEGILMQDRINQMIGKQGAVKHNRNYQLLAERLKKLTDEAHDLLQRLSEKHELSTTPPDEENENRN